MRGIAMAIIGLTLVWMHRKSKDAGQFNKNEVNAGIILQLMWFIATIFVIAGGW